MKKFKAINNIQLVLFGGLVGLLSGFGAVIFRKLINLIHNLAFTQHFSLIYDSNLHTPAMSLPILVILIPIIGSVLVVFLTENFAVEAKGPGVSETIFAIFYKQGIIRPIVALIKALASAISIGTGGSVGREGPIIQIGSALGSTLGQIAKIPADQRIILIAAGAAAGIAATFNTPIGGLAFAVELLLVSINAMSICVVVISTVIATFIGNIYFGITPMFASFTIPLINNDYQYALQLLLTIPFGLIIGFISIVFIRGLFFVEDLFMQVSRNPYIRHIIGMGIIGCMLYFVMYYLGNYYIEGVGYATINDVLHQLISNPWIIIFILVAKLLATCITLGSGGSGGIFSPSLFFGACAGAAYGILINALFLSISINPITFVIAGMAGVVGGATGAVITAVVMAFELTRDYLDVLPILITTAISFAIRLKFCEESIYTLKFFRRGFILPKGLESAFVSVKNAGDIMSTDFIIHTAALRQNVQHSSHEYDILISEGNISEIRSNNLSFNNIYFVHTKTNWNQLMLAIKNVTNPVIIVTSNTEKADYIILGVITQSEILEALQSQASLM